MGTHTLWVWTHTNHTVRFLQEKAAGTVNMANYLTQKHDQIG